MGIVDENRSVSVECQTCPMFGSQCSGRPAGQPCNNELRKHYDTSVPDKLDYYGNDCPFGCSIC